MPNNGGAYIINRRAVSKYLDKTAVDISDNPLLHLSALTKIPEIISNSITGEIHADYKKDNKGSRKLKNGIDSEDLLVHRLYGAINIDGIIYRVKTTMHEHLSNNKPNKPHSYEVTKIELLEDRSLSGHMNRSNSSIDGAKLLDGVEKSYDKGKYLLEESENLDNLTTEEDIRFRVDDEEEQNLVGVHNLTEANLAHVAKMGGIANPSMAVVNRDIATLDNFGEITLVASKSLVDKKSGLNAGTWGADAYSPRYPRVEYRLSDKSSKDLQKRGFVAGLESFDITSLKQEIESNGKRFLVGDRRIQKLYTQEGKSGESVTDYVDRLYDSLDITERLFKGYTWDGTRRYAKHTLENVSRMMKAEGRAGAEGYFGMGSVRAKLTPIFRNIAQIKKNKDRIVSHEEFEEAKNSLESRYYELVKLTSVERFDNAAEDRLIEALLSLNPKKYLKEEYNIEISDKDAEAIKTFAADLRVMPTEYFETKFERPVMLEEFAKAVIPNDASDKTRKILANAGLEVVEYDPKVEGDRLRAVREASDKEGLRFRFIGEKGAGALDKAEEASVRLDNLDVAREMETADKDSKAIKLATGWERGADGKWRYEVGDGEFDGRGELHPERRQLTKEEQSELDNAFDELMDAFEKGALAYDKEITGETDMADIYVAGGMSRERAERLLSLEDKEKELKKSKKHLDDYLDDEGLYAAYPELREIEIVEGDPMLALTGLLGGYDHKNKTLTLYDLAKDTLLHEVQHIIQHIEGFARGGNAKDVSEARRLNAQMQREVESLLNQLDINEWLSRGNIQDIILRNQKEGRYFNLGYAFSESLNEIVGDALRQELDEANRVIAENNRLIGGHSNLSPKEHYRRLGGEVEARNVAKRMSMSAEERRNSIAEETEDVSRADQIFIMDGLGVSEMGSRVDGRMKEVGKHFDGQRLSEEQRAVVDVYSGVRNNLTINVKTKDGNRAIVIRQGTENKAGTKHSLFRHYDTGVGTITAEDIALIPEIIANGAVTEKKRGKSTLNEYKLSKNDVDYTVLTEVDSRREVFADFYTNKKTSTAARSTHSEDARDTAVNVSDGKVSEKTGDLQTDSNESEGQVMFSVREDGEYVAPWGEGESFAEAMDRLSRKENVLNVEVQRMERRQAMGGDIDEADEYVPVSDKILNVTYSAFI